MATPGRVAELKALTPAELLTHCDRGLEAFVAEMAPGVARRIVHHCPPLTSPERAVLRQAEGRGPGLHRLAVTAIYDAWDGTGAGACALARTFGWEIVTEALGEWRNA